MIKFFRNIRKSNLKEGKIANYLKYAIGEIVLVVIGILIALSINNWNDKRKARLNEKMILTELVKNLNSNLEQFSNNIKIENDHINSIDILLNKIENKKPFNDSLIVHFQKITWWERMDIITSTYESLKANGFNDISSAKLKAEIVQIFDVTYLSMKEIINNVAFADGNTLTAPMILRYELMNTKTYERILNDYQYLNYLYARKRWKIDVIKSNKYLIQPTQVLINHIEAELLNKD